MPTNVNLKLRWPDGRPREESMHTRLLKRRAAKLMQTLHRRLHRKEKHSRNVAARKANKARKLLGAGR